MILLLNKTRKKVISSFHASAQPQIDIRNITKYHCELY